MNSISVNQEKSKRTGVKFSFQSILMLMAAIMMAFATLTSCDEDEDPSEDPDEIENGNNGGVAGKRIITTLTESASETFRGDYTYNSNGTLKRIDYYDPSTSKLVRYSITTSNSDGTVAKEELFDTWGDWVFNYSYGSNKKPLKVEGYAITDGIKTPVTIDFTFQNGRLTSSIQKTGTPGDYSYRVNTYEPVYDSNGRRTSTTETDSALGQRKFTRTYNSDGTLQKVTTDGYQGFPNTGYTVTYTWENGKTTVNTDDYSAL